ncbi:MAG TPA: winged helix-turn-helix domain-containing protein [Longimicrobiales bacterium]
MHADADIAPVAALLADAKRAAILFALSDGRALPASELARCARATPSTTSAHLARLVEGGLLAMERHGRHRYYRLAKPEIVAALEALAAVAPPARAATFRESQAGKAIRFARTCYDHLAGELGVRITDALLEQGALVPAGRDFELTAAGAARFAELGIDADRARRRRRAFARACLDWSERRYHLAGALGTALLDRFLELRWIERTPSSRAVRVTNDGRRAFQRHFSVQVY